MDGINLTDVTEDNELKWYHYPLHGGYYLVHGFLEFFSKPYKEPKKDVDLMEHVNSLLCSEKTSENIEKVEHLTSIHREVENTKARRRLEKWSLRVIAIYLIIVLFVVVFSYIEIPNLSIKLVIPEPIMIAILTTTTVNVIGLGLIVLRGHFLANEIIKKNNLQEHL